MSAPLCHLLRAHFSLSPQVGETAGQAGEGASHNEDASMTRIGEFERWA
jgi:hypothetical protein